MVVMSEETNKRVRSESESDDGSIEEIAVTKKKKRKYSTAEYNIVKHNVGMSHMAYSTTEEDIKMFFSPLQCKGVSLVVKDGEPQGKANVLFNSHEEAVEAMAKDKTELCGWTVNLYLDFPDDAKPKTSRGGAGRGGRGKGSEESSGDNWDCSCGFSNFSSRRSCKSCKQTKTRTSKVAVVKSSELTLDDILSEAYDPADATLKLNYTADITMNDIADDTMNDTADDSINDTTEADKSTSEEPKQEFEWDKMITSFLNTTDNKATSLKKLRKVLMLTYIKKKYVEYSKDEFNEKLYQVLKQSSTFTCDNGTVSM